MVGLVSMPFIRAHYLNSPVRDSATLQKPFLRKLSIVSISGGTTQSSSVEQHGTPLLQASSACFRRQKTGRRLVGTEAASDHGANMFIRTVTVAKNMHHIVAASYRELGPTTG